MLVYSYLLPKYCQIKITHKVFVAPNIKHLLLKCLDSFLCWHLLDPPSSGCWLIQAGPGQAGRADSAPHPCIHASLLFQKTSLVCYSRGSNRQLEQEAQSVGALLNTACITLGQHSIASKQATWSTPESEWKDTTTLEGKGHKHRRGQEMGPFMQFTTLGNFAEQERLGMQERASGRIQNTCI